MMTEMIDAIRTAVADGATPEQKELGAQACRTILTALGAEPGKPMAVPSVPQQHPLAGITVDQALTMLIARLSTIAEAKDAAEAKAAAEAKETARAKEANAGPPRPRPAPQIAFVNPSPMPGRRRPR